MVRSTKTADHAERGTSILELVISLAVASVIILAMVTAMDSSSRVTRQATELQRATSEAGRVSNMIVTDLRRASRATVVAQGSTLGFQMYDTIAVDPQTGVPSLVLNATAVSYALVAQAGGPALVRTEGTRTSVVSRQVAAFTVTQITPAVVSLQVQAAIRSATMDPATKQFRVVTAVADVKVPIVGP